MERLCLVRHCRHIGLWHPSGTFSTFIIYYDKHYVYSFILF